MRGTKDETNGIGFDSILGAARALHKCLRNEQYDDPTLWLAATLLFGDDNLIAWGREGGYAKLMDALNDNITVFRDAETTGRGFLIRLYTLWRDGAFVDQNGKNLLETSIHSDCEWNFGITPETVPLIAEKMGISREVVETCLAAILAEQLSTDRGREMALEIAGIAAKDADGNSRKMKDIADDISAAWDTMSDYNKAILSIAFS